MVYCTKCGAENPEGASNCTKCGATLNPAPYREYRRHTEDDVCFGGRSYIWGIIIGLFVIMIGISSLWDLNIWDKIWPLFIILIGLVIITSAITKKRY